MLLEKVLKKIKPTKTELEAEKKTAKEVITKIKQMPGSHIKAEWLGSSARNTHLKGDKDIDIFVLYPLNISRKQFEKEGLNAGKKVFQKGSWEKKFSEHPYIRGTFKGFEVDVVPGYVVKKSSERLSAVDRSPLHHAWLKKHQKTKHKDETRLLKAFLKGIDAYGAKLKFNSVPGYLTELLIIKYGSFNKTIKQISKWKKEKIIKFNSKKGKKFSHHLIVIDPTDENRNVAAALSFHQFNRIIAAANAFLEKPSEKFFFREKRKPLTLKQLNKFLKLKNVLGVKISYPKKALTDIIYGQIKRFSKKTAKQIKLNDFETNYFDVWTDEQKTIIFVFELTALELEKVKKHFGPKITQKKHSEAFKKGKKFVSGPWIEKGKWVGERKRKFWQAKTFLKNFFETESRKERKPLKNVLKKGKVLEKKQLKKMFKKDIEFARFFSRFLKAKKEFFE